MHEWALAEAVIATVIEEARKAEMKKVTEIMIKIGELQQIDSEVFEFALNEIAKNRDLGGMKVKMQIEKAVFRCRVCGQEWNFSDIQMGKNESEAIHFIPEVSHAYIRCDACNSPDFEIIQGRRISIDYIKGKKMEENGPKVECC